MNRHPLTPSPEYNYKRQTNDIAHSALALDQEGRLIGIENIKPFDFPFIPDGLKAAVHEVRMRRAEVKAGQNADELRRISRMKWLMHAG